MTKLNLKSYLTHTPKLAFWQKAGILMLVVSFAGFFGWLYEFIFYYFDAGTGEFYMQGGNFLPWINIYATGSILVLLTCWHLRRSPWAVFLVSFIVTGLLEFLSGWLIYTLGNGTRYWNYNTEILNFGNIGGFVCLRSVLIFSTSALLLIYVVLPFLIRLSRYMSQRTFLTIAIMIFTLIMTDEIYNLLASKFFDWPDAIDFYQNIGWKYYHP